MTFYLPGDNVMFVTSQLLTADFTLLISPFVFHSLPVALFLGGEEKAMPAGPRHTHSEDLQRLEVPQPVPLDEKEPDSGGSLVPPICCETL